MIEVPPEISVVSGLAGNDPWWLGPAAVGALGAKTANRTGIAQHNVLSPYYLGEPSTYGSSV